MSIKTSFLALFAGCLSASLMRPADEPSLASKPPPRNFDETRVLPCTLPDPLVCVDGTRVATIEIWQHKRRLEILRLFESQVYGRAPFVGTKPKFEVTSVEPRALSGRATRKLVTIWLVGQVGGPRLDLLLYVPNHTARPVPAFLGLNFSGNHGITHDLAVPISTRWIKPAYTRGHGNRATEEARGVLADRWQLEKVVERGYAPATIYYGDLEPDHPEGWRDGIRGALGRDGRETIFAPDEWAAIGAWAWGLSRALDYLETDSLVDARRVVVFGHSRLGKAALWAGAVDERFAIVISNNSGEGGAALLRRNFGETIEDANTREPHRFCGNFRQYNRNASALPVDAHMLIALAAPRPVYVASASDDLGADPRGEFLAAKNAEPVYRLFGLRGVEVDDMPEVNRPVGSTIGYHLREGKHDLTEYDWDQYLDFADRHFKRSGSAAP